MSNNELSRLAALIWAVMALAMSTGRGSGLDDPSTVTRASRAETNNPLSQLRRAWAEKRVKSITILNIPRSLHFPVAIPPKGLDSDFRFLLFIPDAPPRPLARRLIETLDRVTARPAPPSHDQADVRWAFVFRDSGAEVLCSIYLDRDGKRGVINGADVEFDSDAFLLWANNTFGGIFDMPGEGQ